MNVLGIETATSICAAAVMSGETVVAECSLEAPQVHSEKLLPLIDECLKTAQFGLAELDGIAISIGPGSFTGLRIGLSVSKGLAFASGKPLLAVPTLEALALKACHHGDALSGEYILSLLDARRDEVYCALYRWDGVHLTTCRGSESLTLQGLLSVLPGDGRILVAGDGETKFLDSLSSANAPELQSRIRRSEARCSGAAVAAIGMMHLEAGEIAEIKSLQPFYVKEFYTVAKPQTTQVIL
ncbi:MAG TPA: tRNA (adenosine(37)-N6)-threonylcarbamoyltransferase complex dimerization subunit type 1 TsaB [Bacteroidota bacterium]|nr:tRNA (adenosine(37)-N6)-threonylcarbamoyltransferase complex dimerization subunit type 1 TsaB [Bacteroidota bacterium]